MGSGPPHSFFSPFGKKALFLYFITVSFTDNWQDQGVLRRELQNAEAGFSLSLSQKSFPFLLFPLNHFHPRRKKNVIWIGTE